AGRSGPGPDGFRERVLRQVLDDPLTGRPGAAAGKATTPGGERPFINNPLTDLHLAYYFRPVGVA
ncbi:hypothetical protein, partial [Streptomyces thermolilacinus]|uniref:hypothetical protein n=1 Tax=Streptomyces thermolilacinus TaxID=285540 RepID=UPI003404A9AA